MSRVTLASAECKISAQWSRVTGHAEQFEMVQYNLCTLGTDKISIKWTIFMCNIAYNMYINQGFKLETTPLQFKLLGGPGGVLCAVNFRRLERL